MTVINDNVPVFLVQVRLYINATFKISRSIRAFELTESGREISLPSGSFVKFQLPMDLRWLLHNTDAIYRSVFFLSFFFTFSNLIQDLSDTLHFYFKFLRKTKLIVIFFTASKLIKSLIQTDKFSFPRTFPRVSFLLPWNGYPVKQGRIIEKLVVTVISARSRHHQFFFHKKKKRHKTPHHRPCLPPPPPPKNRLTSRYGIYHCLRTESLSNIDQRHSASQYVFLSPPCSILSSLSFPFLFLFFSFVARVRGTRPGFRHVDQQWSICSRSSSSFPCPPALCLHLDTCLLERGNTRRSLSNWTSVRWTSTDRFPDPD